MEEDRIRLPNCFGKFNSWGNDQEADPYCQQCGLKLECHDKKTGNSIYGGK